MKASIEIDRQCIAEAVLPPRERLLDFGAVTMLVDEILLPSIQLEDIGNINIPLSLLDAERIKVFSRKQQLVAGASTNTISISPREHSFEIDSSKFLLSTNTEISSLVIKQLGLPVTKTMKIEAYLDKLILHEVDGQYTHTADLDKEFGTFGTVILHLPVAGGHEGGNILMRYKGEQVSCDDCDKLFLSSFYNSCEFIMNPVTRGLKLTLLFNLVWTNSNIAIPADFPSFLTSKKKLESALIPWIANQNEDVFLVQHHPLRKGNTNIKMPINTFIEEKTIFSSNAASSTGLPSIIVLNESSDSRCSMNDEESSYSDDDCSLTEEDDTDQPDSDIDDSFNYGESDEKGSDDDYPVENNDFHCNLKNPTTKCQEKDVLFFVLEGKYCDKNLKFHHLHGKDRILADLLRCCPYIDVHLAKVTHTHTKQGKLNADRSETSKIKEIQLTSTMISTWIDSDGTIKDLNIDELDWKEKCVGPIRNLLEHKGITPDVEYKFNKFISAHTSYGESGGYCREDRAKILQKLYFHTILVMWPKHRSVEIYCRYGLGMLLNNLESPLTSAPGWQASAQHQLTQDLHQAVEYCCTYPQRIWTQPAFKNGELTLRLLRLCSALRARQEGLKILKILGSEFDTEAKDSKFKTFEGIQNEQVAQEVVKFVCTYNNGWSECVDLIKGLITADRIGKQFVPIVKLIQFFLDVKCIKGAMLVGDCLASSIVNLDQHGAAHLEESDVTLYMDSIVSLELCPEASCQERVASMVSLFPKLHLVVQCRLILQLEAQGSSRFMGIASCQSVFFQICQIFQSSKISDVPFPSAVGLLNCFIRLGNSEWLKSLISKMTSVPVQRNLMVNKIFFLEHLLLDRTFWYSTSSSDLGKTAIMSVVDVYSTLLLKQLSTLKQETSFFSYKVNDQGNDDLLTSLTNVYLRTMMRMERNPKLPDPQRIPCISSKLSQLSFEHLSTILNLFQSSNSQNFNKHPCYSVMMGEICKHLISKMKQNVMQSRKEVLHMVWCIIGFLEKSLVQSLIKEVCEVEAAGSWSPDSKYQFFNDLISSFDTWGKLESTSQLNILNTCAALIESWVTEAYQTLHPKLQIRQNQKSIFDLCVRLFFLIEKHRFDPNQKNINRRIFQIYLEKLPLIHLKDFLLDLHISLVTTKPCIKKFPICLDFFSELCRHFVDQQFLSIRNSEEDYCKIMNCLLWIDDAHSWRSFADRICSSVFITDGNHQPFQRIFLDNGIQNAIVDSSFSYDAFRRIADYWVSKWKLVKEPSFTWCMPNAIVPNHPTVEQFLKSSQTTLNYKIKGCRIFAKFKDELDEYGPSSGFSVKKLEWNSENKMCRLEKTRDHHERVTEPYRKLTMEMENVLKLRQSLSRRRAAAKLTEKRHLESVPSSTTSDEVLILSPPKRAKVLELTID